MATGMMKAALGGIMNHQRHDAEDVIVIIWQAEKTVLGDSG